MALRLAQLPLVFDCPRFEPVAADDATTCARCREVVHDLSALTEPELRRFLARHAGEPVCVSVRVDRGGSLVLRDTPRILSAGFGLLALLAAAGCAVHGEGLATAEPEPETVAVDLAAEPIVRGIVVTVPLSGEGQGYIGTRQALPDAGARYARRFAWRRLRGR